MNAREYLGSCNAKEILSPEGYRDYEEMMRGLWPDMIALNSNMYLLTKISEFPFAFLGVDSHPYWATTERALVDGCILTLWRVALDTNSSGRTLLHIKNRLFSVVLDPRAQIALAEVVETDFPRGWAPGWASKIEEIRHGYVAHYDFRKHVRPTEDEIAKRSLRFQELKEAQTQVVDLFDLLSLNVKFNATPPEYDPNVQMGRRDDPRNDIERILDSLARESHLVNLPERDPALWRLESQRIDSKDRERLNSYRRKFGLGEV